MVETYLAELRRIVSSERLAKYQAFSDSALETLVTYLWNIALSEALYPSLCTLEVALRNSIHNALVQSTGTDLWFRDVLLPRDFQRYKEKHDELRRKSRNPPTAGKVVAELNFGFWVSLLTQPYNQRIWAPNRAEIFHMAFPHLPPTPNQRRYVHHRLNIARGLRNRVMHHEPIWNGFRWGQTNFALDVLHVELREAIGWISPPVKASMDLYDRFPEVYENRRHQIEIDLIRQLG